MNAICRFLWPGLLALTLSGGVYAHGERGGYDYGGWSGNASVWGDSSGHYGYGGAIGYSVGRGYSPGYVPWLGGHHGPRCHHPGHRHGYKHWRKHHRKHYRKHHRKHHWERHGHRH